MNPDWKFVETSDFLDLADKITQYEKEIRNDGSPTDPGVPDAIADFIKDRGIDYFKSGQLVWDGKVAKVTFSGLKEGLYFFMMTAGPDGPKHVNIKSAIVPMPFVYYRAMYYDPLDLTVKTVVNTDPPTTSPPVITPTPTPTTTPTPTPTPTRTPPPYTPPGPPNPPINPPVNPPQPNQNEIIIDDYDTPLGIAVEMNHVGDCYE